MDSSNHVHALPSTSPDHTPPDHPESNDEDRDLTPLEYARLNGLSRDYFNTPYLISNLDILEDSQDGIVDDSHLTQFDLVAQVSTDERLTLSKEAAILIASVSRCEDTSESMDAIVLQMVGCRKFKNARLELPLLRSHHETDLKRFAQREGFEIKLGNVKFPLEIVDEENNEGLAFPSKLWNRGSELIEGLKKEKLVLSRETTKYLSNIVKASWAEDDEMKLWSSVQTYRRNTALEPVTPPLSPLHDAPLPFEPSISDPAFQIPILSDPASLTNEDLKAIEKKIFEQDVPTPIRSLVVEHDESSLATLVGFGTVKLADIYSPVASLDSPPISPTIETQRFKREDLMVEEPLTPTNPAVLPKSVRFSDDVMECPLAEGSLSTDAFGSSFFEDAFRDAHERANRLSEQEALIPADATARVEVPIMDFSLPDPPWKAMQSVPLSSSLVVMQKSMIADIVGQGLPRWPDKMKDQLELRWNPFTRDFANNAALEEDFPKDDFTWKAFVNGPGDDDVIDTSILTWKPPGLRILKEEEEDDDDEIELGQFEKGVPQDISFLVKKRKIEIEERGSGGEPGAHDAPINSMVKQPPGKKTPHPYDFNPAANKLQLGHPDEGRMGLLMGGAFSVENSVDNFLELRGTKKPKLGDSSSFAKVYGPAKPNPQPDILTQIPIRKSPTAKSYPPLPAPPTSIPTNPTYVIIASNLLKHRALIKHIEAQLPSLVLVERDFSAHNTTIWMPNSVSRSPIASPLETEADIIISPSVGIIITTLQKIKQKPLPGQKGKPAIRERLEKVSVRYEKLVVLISEGRGDETTRELDDSDCSAFADFVGFVLCLETTISVQFVGGGEETLAKWLVSAVIQHRTEDGLLQDETHWELFLRRAGLNAFAAQYVIWAVKAPESVDAKSHTKAGHFGLTAFVEMGPEQRIARFGAVCGKRIMERVSLLVDARWAS